MGNHQHSLRAVVGVLTAGRLLIATASRFVYPFLPAIARGLGVSLSQAGLLVSARWLAGLSAPVVVTVVGRGRRRRRLAAFGLALFALGAALTAATNLWVGALVGFVLLGVAKPAYDVAAQAYVADRSDYRRRARYMSIIELTWAGGLLVGAPAAGWLIDRGSWNTPFWVLAILGVVALVAMQRLLEPDPARDDAAPAPFRLGRSTLALLGVATLFSLSGEVVFVVFGAWLEDSFGLSLLNLGAIAALVGVSELAGEGATLAFADRLGLRRSVALGLLVSSAAYLGLLGFADVLPIGLTLVAIALGGFEFTVVSALPLASELLREARARYLAWMAVAFSIGRSVGAAIGPLVFREFGVPGNAVVAVLANAAALAVLMAFVVERRDQAVDA